jgi:hypothetical protein
VLKINELRLRMKTLERRVLVVAVDGAVSHAAIFQILNEVYGEKALSECDLMKTHKVARSVRPRFPQDRTDRITIGLVRRLTSKESFNSCCPEHRSIRLRSIFMRWGSKLKNAR